MGGIFQILPTSLAEWVGRKGLGALLWYVFPYRFSVAYHNLGVVFPDMTRRAKMKMLHQIYEHYGWVLASYYVMPRKSFKKRILNADSSGTYDEHSPLTEGKGSVYCVSHFGHWEAFIAFLALKNYPFTGIYKVQKNPLSDAYFINHRQKFGRLEHISSQAGMRAFLDVLRENRMLGIAIDQNYRRKGIPVSFFGREFFAARGAAMFALKKKSPVVVAAFYLENGKFVYEEHRMDLPEYDEITDEAIADIMQILIQQTEEIILKHPEQWLWFHKVWQGIYSEKIRRTWREYLI